MVWDVIVAGAGLAGACLAYQLASRSCSVAVIEHGVCASRGATWASGGLVRVYDSDPDLMELAAAGVRYWHRWPFPAKAPFEAQGVVHIVPEHDVLQHRHALQAMSTQAYPIEILGPDEARRRFPWLSRETGTGWAVVFEPKGGVSDPRRAALLHLDAARGAGAMLLEACPMYSLEEDHNGVTVRSREASIRGRTLVLACGAWSSRWLPDCSLTARRIQLTRAKPGQHLPDLCVIDALKGGYYGVSRSSPAFVGSGAPDKITELDEPLLADKARRARHSAFFDALAGRPVDLLDCIVGMDAYTPDYKPMIGFADPQTRLFRFTGFSGRGAKYIPSLAASAAQELARALRH